MLETKKAATEAAPMNTTKIQNIPAATKRAADILLDIDSEMKRVVDNILDEENFYMKYYLDVSLPVAEDDFLFEIGGVPTIPAGELVALTGKAKKGKSQFQYFLLGSILAGEAKGIVKPLKDGYRVCVFDTEQSRRSLLKCCQRALRFGGKPINENDERVLPFALRPVSIEERKSVIEQCIKKQRPNLVFIDGIRDLVADFNNLQQSNDIIQWLLNLTAEYRCTVFCVLHQNKKEGDTTMRGHLGTELLNKVTDCIEVKKENGKFTASCTDSRNVPFESVCFSLDREGWIQIEEADRTTQSDKKAADIQRVLGQCLKAESSLTYADLVRMYALEGAVSEATAKRHIKLAKDNEFLVVSNGRYQLRIR